MFRSGRLIAGATVVIVGLTTAGVRPLTITALARQSPQSCSRTSELDDLLAQSAASYEARNAPQGVALLREALDLATSAKCPRYRAEALRRLAIADSYAERYRDAEQKLTEALPLFVAAEDKSGEGQTLSQLGLVLVRARRVDEATPHLVKGLAILKMLGDVPAMFGAYVGLMYSLPDGPDKDRLRAEALDLMRATPRGRPSECNVLHEWGDELFGNGKYSASFTRLTEAIRCFEEVDDRSRLGRALVSLGRVYRVHGRLDAALAQYMRALDVQQRTEDREAIIQTLNAIAVTLGFMGKADAALSRYDEALALARSLGNKTILQFLLANVAGGNLDIGRYREAAAALEEVLADPTTSFRVERLTQLAEAYLGLGQPARALAVAERAVAETGEGQPQELVALPTRARALSALGRFDDASTDMQRAIAAFERLRANTVPDDFLKRGFGQRHQDLFATTISLLQAKGSPREAVETAERARARAFLDLLAERTAARPAATSSPPATFPEMVSTAARLHSTVVAYWVDTQATFVWVVQPDGRIASARIDVTAARLASMVRDATGAGAPAGVMMGTGSAMRPWRALYRLLVEPIRSRLPSRPGARLTIVPHGPLFGLPFAALRDASDRYLIESYDIHYVPAVAVLSYTSRPRSSPASASLLVGDPGPGTVSDGLTELPPIPWSGREVRAIGAILRNQTTVMVGDEASELRVRDRLAGRSLLHFATHGLVHNEESLASYLALRPSAGGPDADGRLTADEIYGLHLDADLVVLSGCRTALGPVSGEGVIGFTRAFLVAGASSVIATTWDVPDQTSFEVMRTFYRAWIAGRGKSRSLRSAQLALIDALRAGRIRTDAGPLPESPRLWAGFVLVGEP